MWRSIGWPAALLQGLAVLFFQSRPARIRIYWPGAVASAAIGALIEWIGRPEPFWVTERLFWPIGGVDMILIGIYALQGLFFFQLMPPWGGWRLAWALAQAAGSVFFEVGSIWGGYARAAPGALAASAAMHCVRFLALAGLYHGLGTERQAADLARRRHAARRATRQRMVWRAAWPLFGAAAWACGRLARAALPAGSGARVEGGRRAILRRAVRWLWRRRQRARAV